MKLSFNTQFLDVLSSINPQRQTSILKLNKELDTFQSVSWYDLQGNVKIHCNNDSIFVEVIRNIPDFKVYSSFKISLLKFSRFIKFADPDETVRKIQRALHLAVDHKDEKSSYTPEEINDWLLPMANDRVEITYYESFKEIPSDHPMLSRSFRTAIFQIIEALIHLK